ncbi:uncharacterized protein LOC135173120 isoform X2 [Diachasmimorpha longicaudata]
MFDELARKEQANNHSGDQIPAAIQKRLSLVASHSQRNTIFGQICSAGYTEKHLTMEENQMPEVTVCHGLEENKGTKGCTMINNCITKTKYNNNRLAPEQGLCGRQKKQLGRPLSGSSIASSTSSSGGSNQENTVSANPYLASVESLADACASSQVSGDSGVGAGSAEEPHCLLLREAINRRKTIPQESVFRNTVERVLLEIVDTEAIYVEHLCQVIQGYLIVWRDDPNSLLTQFELSNLFNNIEDIFSFNSQFLKEIKECQLKPILVANTFIKHNSGFKVYTEYCTKYPRAVSILTELMSREETAKAFRERQEALGHALPLGSFLLKPVQRILKYHLLLENLSKEFEADDAGRNFNEGKSTIDEALKAMTGIAEHINAMKRKHEHAVRVQEIQSLLYGWTGADLTTNGELIAEGRFRMRGAKAPRHAFLFERMLLLTKKKEDGLLVYKAHIMCSNLMLIESIPGEPFSFHVIPFDNPRLQYTLQARNLEHKREWTLQIKRVMLENYNAVIPIHARQLVLQLGQSHHDDEATTEKISMKKLYTSPPEYLERRKQEKDRRRSEAGMGPKSKKNIAKFDGNSTESPSFSSSSSTSSSSSGQREQGLNRSLDGRALKVKDRLTNWRRKSEPGFQSYVSFNNSDNDEEKEKDINEKANNSINNQNNLPGNSSPTEAINCPIPEDRREENMKNNLAPNKDVNMEPQTVEQIVGHILMQNEEFQKLLEKQRNNSMTNVRQQQRFHKDQQMNTPMDTSEESDNCDSYPSNPINNRMRLNRITGANRERREYRSMRSNNSSWTSRYQSDKSPGSQLRLQYNNFKADTDQPKPQDKTFKRQTILTESKIIKTALRINDDSREEGKVDCPTRPSVWLTQLCEDLPTSPHKSGSLPRSFQINPEPRENYSQEKIDKSRFLQRDGKPFNERPFTIASDKPADISLEDMERYNSYQSEEQINQLSNSDLNSASTFFCSLEDNSTVDSDSDRIHPDHRIYRSTMLKNVLSKAGSRLQGLRLTLSTEALESSDPADSKSRSHKGKKRSKSKLLRISRESSTDVDEPTGCVPIRSSEGKSVSSLWYQQGSEGLGARIAQADYADPSVLFGAYFEGKAERERAARNDEKYCEDEAAEDCQEVDVKESDCFYEKSFESIEDYATLTHNEGKDDAFRDSAIFSDDEGKGEGGDIFGRKSEGKKIPPPVPVKKHCLKEMTKRGKPSIAAKPEGLKVRPVGDRRSEGTGVKCIRVSLVQGDQGGTVGEVNDISAGQSQVGWVKRMVGQLQAQIEA